MFVQTCLHKHLTFDPRGFLQITQHVGQCGPVAGTVDSAAVIFCSQLVNSLVSTDPLTGFMHQNIFIRENVDPSPFPAGFCLPVEHILVRPRLVPDLLHPQHHLFCQTSQILPENEVFRSPRVSSRTTLLILVTAATFNQSDCLYLQ